MTTAATIHTTNNAHWYFTDGRPCYELPKKDGKGTKNPTLADARKLNLLPSVTSILQVLDKPALNDWKVTQGILAIETSPRLPEECDPPCPKCGQSKLKDLDAFLKRILQVERVQDQEAEKAREIGTEIHSALESYFLGQDVPEKMRPWMEPAAKAIANNGQLVTAEKILVGDGYAGKTDLIQEGFEAWQIWDFKTTKKLPEKSSWDEHVLQLSAYAAAYFRLISGLAEPQKPIRTFNCYISTVDQGKFIIHENNPDWQKDYNDGFAPILKHWQWKNQYRAQQ